MDEAKLIWARLQRLLRRRGCSREDSEDMIQDAFLRLHIYCKSGEVREREAFLVRTALNLAIDRRRRLQHRMFTPEALEDLPLVDDTPAPDEVVDLQQRLDLTEHALGAVSRRARGIYRMNCIDGYSYSEIAKKLGISVSAVEKHMTRALASLMTQSLSK